MGPRACVALFAGFLALAVPASASANETAAVVNNVVEVNGDDGANSISFAEGAHLDSGGDYGAEIWDNDRSATVSPGAGCVATTDFRNGDNWPVVWCGSSSVNSIEVLGNDGDDTISNQLGGSGGNGQSKPFTSIHLVGGAGDDTLNPLSGDPASGVVADGGDGNDTVPRQAYHTPITVNGGAGDDDLTGSVEGDVIDGGDGNDTISGEEGDDQLRGGPGNDTIAGAAGNDTIDGGSGRDSLSGDGDTIDPGNDTIEAADGERDTVSCDFGADSAHVDQFDVVERGSPAGCEEVSVARASLSLPAGQRPIAKKGIRADVSCSTAAYVRAWATIKVGSAKPFELDSDAVHLGAGKKHHFLLKLPGKRVRAMRAALRHGKKVVATVHGELTDPNGDDFGDTPGKKLTIRG